MTIRPPDPPVLPPTNQDYPAFPLNVIKSEGLVRVGYPHFLWGEGMVGWVDKK